MKTMQKGFTLIELMIVIAIIGILASVAIPQYQNYIARSEVQTSLGDIRGYILAIEDYGNRFGAAPADNAALTSYTGFVPAANMSTNSKWTVAHAPADWSVTTTFAAGSSAIITGETYTYTPTFVASTSSAGNESVSWALTDTLDPGFEPKL